MTVKFDTGIIFRKGNTAKLNLSTHKIEFANDDNYNYKVYNFLSGISGDDMFSIYNSICGVAILCDSTDVFLIKEIDLYFVASASNMPQFTFRNKKLVSINTDDYTVTGITY